MNSTKSHCDVSRVTMMFDVPLGITMKHYVVQLMGCVKKIG